MKALLVRDFLLNHLNHTAVDFERPFPKEGKVDVVVAVVEPVVVTVLMVVVSIQSQF